MAKKKNDATQGILEVAAFLAEFVHDPVGFVYAAFPWGEGELEGQQPDPWQLGLLEDIANGLKTPNEVIREAVASGNGIGKSCLVSWILLWAISTFEDTKGVVTANTEKQLTTKTWAELAKWHRLFIGRDMFTYTATAYFSNDPDHERTWRIDAIPWSDANPEAFAGLHNQRKRIVLIFDEASAISDAIWETAEGAMTDKDTEIIWCCFGNPTRNSGRFYDCFGRQRNIWRNKQIDSRTVAISNKSVLQTWVDTYGEDSDFVRVHVRGLFPVCGNGQLVPANIVVIAQKRKIEEKHYSFAPVVFGLDPAWTGEDKLILYMRQGNYSKILMEIAKNDNDMYVAGKCAVFEDEYGMQAGFIDMGYGTGIYSALKSMGRTNWRIVSFNEKASNEYYANKRAEIWCEMKEWLKEGGCIEDRQDIHNDLVSPEAFINRSGKFQLESKEDMKKRGLASPNYADALALTFAYPVITNKNSKFKRARSEGKIKKYGAM